jgi:hypothetical protein
VPPHQRRRLTMHGTGHIAVAVALSFITIVMHGVGTLWIANAFRNPLFGTARGHPRIIVILLGAGVLAILLLHLLEAGVWALSLWGLGAFERMDTAIYFSIVSYATVGYGDVVPDGAWRTAGAIEGLTGMLVVGWSTGLIVAGIGRFQDAMLPASPPGHPTNNARGASSDWTAPSEH